MEVEDDVFFQELSRRISILIMDDDEAPIASYPSVSLQEFSRTMHPTTQSPYLYDQQTTCRRESKGTGVFIPQSSQWRRKNRHGRFNSFNTKSQKQPAAENTRGAVSHVPYNNINVSNPQYSFDNSRK